MSMKTSPDLSAAPGVATFRLLVAFLDSCLSQEQIGGASDLVSGFLWLLRCPQHACLPLLDGVVRRVMHHWLGVG